MPHIDNLSDNRAACTNIMSLHRQPVIYDVLFCYLEIKSMEKYFTENQQKIKQIYANKTAIYKKYFQLIFTALIFLLKGFFFYYYILQT